MIRTASEENTVLDVAKNKHPYDTDTDRDPEQGFQVPLNLLGAKKLSSNIYLIPSMKYSLNCFVLQQRIMKMHEISCRLVAFL